MSSVPKGLTEARRPGTLRVVPRAAEPSREAMAFDLIERIYAAAQEPRLWTTFLERLTSAVGGTVAAMACDDVRASYPGVMAATRLDAALSFADRECPSSRDSAAGGRGAGARSGEVVTGRMTPSSRGPLEKEPDDDRARRLDVGHFLGAVLFREHDRKARVVVLRPGGSGPFGEADADLLRSLVPHLRRSLALQGTIARQLRERAAAMETLDGIPVGIVLLDGSGKALFFNRAASQMFAVKDGVSLGPDGLTAATRDETRELRRLIADVAGAAGAPCPPSGRVLALSRPSLRRAYCVVVKPLTPAVSSSSRNQPAVAVFLTDPDRRTKPDGGVLQNLYGFTPAESRVAAELMQGESVEEAANDLDVSLNTARTHVKHLFEKTDTHTHRELVRLLLCSSCCSAVAQTPRNAHHTPLPQPAWKLQTPAGAVPSAAS